MFIFYHYLLTQLIPGYRGFTIDSLRKLDILDDLRISADAKHHFKGLARRKGELLCPSVLFVCLFV